jgi:hypothetical protein
LYQFSFRDGSPCGGGSLYQLNRVREAGGFQLGENRVLRGCAHNLNPQFSSDEEEQRGDGLNVITQTEVEGIIRVDADHLHFSSPVTREVLENRIKDLARPAPRSCENNQYWLFGFQYFCLETRCGELQGRYDVFTRVHLFVYFFHSDRTFAQTVPRTTMFANALKGNILQV